MSVSRNFIRSIVIAALGASVIPVSGFAEVQEPSRSGGQTQFQQLQYPELQVTPLASQRLEMEAKKEQSGTWSRHLPVQVSALSTIVAAGMLSSEDKASFNGDKKDQANYAATTGFVIGAGWLGLTSWMAMSYRPYAEGVQEVTGLAAANRKDNLVKERVAEEAIDHAASVGRRLTWLSVISNVAANGFVAASADSKGTKSVAALAALTAFAPVIFPYRWGQVADQHDLYKKRIYAPIVTSGWQVRDGEAAPMLFAHFLF